MEGGMKNSAVNKLNRNLFNGAPVLHWADQKLCINTDLIPSGMMPAASVIVVQSPMSPMAQATVVDAAYAPPGSVVVVTTSQPGTIASPPAPYKSDIESQATHAAPATANPAREMAFSLPSRITPGQRLNIAAPDGQIITFVVEGHHQPGQQVVVPY
eukprot:gene26527-32057_t